MVGASGGTLGGRERIVIVDELLPGRLKRAARRHVLRRPRHWHSVLAIAVCLLALTAAPPLVESDSRALSAAALRLPAYLLLATVAVMAAMLVSVGRQIDTEVVPGRLIGLAVGSRTLRYRDHDSCMEYAYSSVRAVKQLGDVVVVDLGTRFWAVPLELFDGVSLEVLRTRAGRPGIPGDLWPELAA
jgi:hypothetical protein